MDCSWERSGQQHERQEKVEEYRFKDMYKQIKDVVSAYSDSGERTAAIAGYLRCMDPSEVLTIEQSNMILALRYPGEME